MQFPQAQSLSQTASRPNGGSAMPENKGREAPSGRDQRVHRFIETAFSFWRGPERGKAWFFSIAFLLLLLVNVGAALGVNAWSKFFFDALERKDVPSLWTGVGIILGLALVSAALAVAIVHVRMRFQLHWRRWIVDKILGRWLAERRFYQLSIIGGEADNPEARISDDVRLSVELFVDFVGGVINAIISALSFIAVLWTVGGSLEVAGINIPGYMVIACVIYCAITTLGMFLMGRPLVRRVADKAAGEAQFRYELTRVKDSAENIALIGGDADERAGLKQTFSELAEKYRRVITQQGHMTWLSGTNMVLASVIPLLLGAPNYLSGAMTLGSLMQAAAAFVAVQTALNWLADNALRLADWFASARRVAELETALDRLQSALGYEQEGELVKLGDSPDSSVHFRDLAISQHDGKLMIDETDMTIAPGEKVLMKGFSGSGKSTLIRAMAGLWPWGSGEILIPRGAKIAFMPQRPYFPLGTLRDALFYPETNSKPDDAAIHNVLVRCGLEHLIPDLEQEKNWSLVLSGGEQQRVAFARVLLNPPDILIMDEPTSALDELSQFKLLEYMRDDLADAIVIHVGHRPGLEKFHTREMKLVRAETGGAASAEEREYGPSFRMIQRLGDMLQRGTRSMSEN
jgi:putative ATP-binding cassette transporter